MRRIANPSSARSQHGAATIFITIVLLLAVGLIGLYTNRGAIMEQRLAANEIRAKQAFAAANAGLEAALAFWHTTGVNIPTTNADRILLTELQNGAGRISYFQARFYDSDPLAAVPPLVAIPPCPALRTEVMALEPQPRSLQQILVVSCGWNDDGTSVQRVSQVIGPSDSNAGGVAAPLVAKGTANLLTGGATIMNYYNDLTVWTGLNLLGLSNTAKTMVRDTANPLYEFPVGDGRLRPQDNSPACNNPPPKYVCSTQGSTLGHDTVTGDTNLFNQPDMFKFVFGKEAIPYRDTAATWIVDPAGTLPNRDTTDIDSIVGKTSQTIWIEGNVNGTLPSGPVTIGAQNKPVILIINGNLDLSSFSGEINGMVFVTGNVTGNGSPTIYGSLVVAGNVDLSGNIKIVYDPGATGSPPPIGKAAKLPGTWRDW